MKDDDEREKEETLVRAHNHSHTVHDKLFTQAIGGGQWRTLPAAVQNSLITRSIATWNKNLKKQRQKITVERFSFQPKDDEASRVWMHGLFAEVNIQKGTRFTGSYTDEAISRAQMITRTATSDKLMKINGMFVDGTDPRFASYLSIANTCPPAGHPNTEAFELDGGKEVCFNTTRMMAKGEQILWKCHEIFDEPNKLVDFVDPASCDLQIEQQEEDSDAVADAIESEAPPCPSGHSTNRSRADDEGYQLQPLPSIRAPRSNTLGVRPVRLRLRLVLPVLRSMAVPNRA